MMQPSHTQVNDQLEEELVAALKILHIARWSALSALLTTLMGLFSLFTALFTLFKGMVALVLWLLLFFRVKLAQWHTWAIAKQQSYQSPFRSQQAQQEGGAHGPTAADR